MRAWTHGGRGAHGHLAASGAPHRYGGHHRVAGVPVGPFSLGLAALLAAAAAIVAAVALTGQRGGADSLLSSKAPANSAPGSHSSSGAPGAPSVPAKPRSRTRVVSIPSNVGNATERLTVTLSGKPAPGSPRPRLSPAAGGSWTVSEDSEVFRSSSTLTPCSTYRLTVPAGTTATGDTALGHSRSVMLKVACPSTRGLQQALARLAYLPDSLRAAAHAQVSHGAIGRRGAAHLLYEPVAGTLRPDVAYAPPLSYGSFDNTTKGALMVFQEDHKLQPDGVAGPLTWQRLLTAVARNYRNPSPYTFVTVTESLPETLKVHEGNRVVLTTPANTGVPGAETEQGAFPIFERLTSTTMTGTDPNGTKYSDPGVPWVNYFNGGDAVHGFIRPGYGYPQSNGCVELPIETAHRVFGMLRLGDMVVVS